MIKKVSVKKLKADRLTSSDDFGFAGRLNDRLNEWFDEHRDCEIIELLCSKNKRGMSEAIIVYEEVSNG